MRNVIAFLVILMCLLIANIVAYSMSEDYRFFLKKIKYSQEVVYEIQSPVDDNNRIEVVTQDSLKSWDNWETDTPANYTSKDSLTFLDALSGKKLISRDDELPEMTQIEKDFVALFDEFNLKELEQKSSLFDVTTEYPDEYYEFYSNDISVYVFPTKTYKEVGNIFQVLAFELPYTLKEVNNFADQSFYINIDKQYNDNTVRIVLEYENRSFWLKIKKDRYNTVKKILEQLR